MDVKKLNVKSLGKGIYEILRKRLRLTEREKAYFENRLYESEMSKSIKFILGKPTFPLKRKRKK